MKIYPLISFFLCAALIVIGQTRSYTNEAEQNIRSMANLVTGPGALGFDSRYEGTKGSPYLFDDWKEAKAKLVGQDTFSASIKMNVDLIRQVMNIQLRDGSTGYISPFNIKTFAIEESYEKNKQWIVMPKNKVEGGSDEQPKFYEVLYQGNDYTLLKETKKVLIKATYNQAYSVSRNYDEFVTEYYYWLKEGNAAFQKVSLRKKAIEKILSDKDTIVRRATKSENIDLTEEKGIVQLLEFLETN